jgi:enamine deaminase RidA (YjgF/YER057c/UK114 family)
VNVRAINPETLGAPRGYSHGMLAPSGGRLLFVAGQTARDAEGDRPAGTPAEEWERCLRNVVRVVRAAGGDVPDIGRLTIYVTDREEYLANLKPIGESYRNVMGRHFPAMALVEVAGLVEEGARVEIEATAVVPPADTPGAPGSGGSTRPDHSSSD